MASLERRTPPGTSRDGCSPSSDSLLDPSGFADGDRDQIADAVAAGQRGLGALRNGGQPAARAAAESAFEAIADELSLEGWRRRSVRWMLVHEPDRVASMFRSPKC